MPYHVSGSIEGVAPILFNRPYTEPSSTQTEEKRKATAARERIYLGPDGVFMPAWTFKKMLCVDGATRAGLKIKRTGLSKFLLPGLFMDGDPRFGVQEADFLHEVWGRVPPRTGAMVKIWRPALETGWHLAFGFQVYDDLIDASQIREALDVAGLKVGLGGWRPEYGRFVVREWEVA
jgi:hypothetical protein